MPPPRPEQADAAAPPARRTPGPLVAGPLRFLVPLAGSVAVHALLLVLITLTTWTTYRSLTASAGPEFSVGIVSTSGGREFGTKWHDTPPVVGQTGSELQPNLAAQPPDLAGLMQGGGAATGTEALDRAQPAAGSGIGRGNHVGLLGIGQGADRSGTGSIGFGSGAGTARGTAGVWNLSARGNRFVYVVDFSGSIVVAVSDLRRELKRSIGNLQSDQSFNVIVFYSTPGRRSEEFRIESFAPKLQPATSRNKRDFFSWIDAKRPQGSTRPLAAVQRALTMDPQALFLFSDGVFEDTVVDEITAANRKPAQIHCLVFDELLLAETNGMPRPTDGARRLQRISERSGGQTKIVTARDLD